MFSGRISPFRTDPEETKIRYHFSSEPTATGERHDLVIEISL
jgi:hypothetical protein